MLFVNISASAFFFGLSLIKAYVTMSVILMSVVHEEIHQPFPKKVHFGWAFQSCGDAQFGMEIGIQAFKEMRHGLPCNSAC